MSSTPSHNVPHDQNNNHHNNFVMNISCNNNNNSNNTTFVQADPSNFRSLVQKLTGLESDKLPSIGISKSVDKGPRARSSTFKLHERRHSARKLENIFTGNKTTTLCTRQKIGISSFLASPVSPLEMLTRGISPRSTMEEEEEEEKAIAEKIFYLHPSTPRASQPPQLLPLFPLHSPTPTYH